MGDSTTAIGWLHKTKIMGQYMDVEDFQARTKIARKLATLVIENDMCLYSQWFAGKQNIIADSLSRDFDVSDNDLTNHFFSLFPTQMPSNFQISPPPAEITSFVWETLSELRKRKQSLDTHTSSELHPGKCGNNSCFDADGTGVSFWMSVQESKSMTYSADSPKPDECPVRTASRSPVDTSKIPLETYHRAFVSLEEPTQDSTTKD